jgi:predicted nucleic acid-binding Zn ribbon protein
MDNVAPATATCPQCGAETTQEETFCSSCGAKLRIEDERPPKEVRKAAVWVLVLAAIFVVSGTFLGFKTYKQAEEAKANLAGLDDSMVIPQPIEGKKYTVGELRAQIDKEVRLVFGMNYFLAIVMVGLYFWARRAPFPALVTALCIYLAVLVLGAIVDPANIIKGVLIKVLVIAALVAGIRTALKARHHAPTSR